MTTLTDKLANLANAGFQEAGDPTADTFAGDVVHEPTADAPLPAAVSERSGPGWVFLYNTRTGERVTVNRWNVEDALKKVHKDPSYPVWQGKRLFSRKPTVEYVLGTFKCLLHPDAPDRKAYNALGLPSCNGAHFPSPDQVEQHMAKRHKAEWATILRTRQEAERQEDRDIQRKQTEALMAIVERQALPTTDVAKAPDGTSGVLMCSDCSETFNRGNAAANQMAMQRHKAKEHPVK